MPVAGGGQDFGRIGDIAYSRSFLWRSSPHAWRHCVHCGQIGCPTHYRVSWIPWSDPSVCLTSFCTSKNAASVNTPSALSQVPFAFLARSPRPTMCRREQISCASLGRDSCDELPSDVGSGSPTSEVRSGAASRASSVVPTTSRTPPGRDEIHTRPEISMAAGAGRYR
jgi:hypothetical protein